MKKREVIIVVLAGLIGTYGLLDYFVFSGKGLTGGDKIIAEEIVKINEFVDTAGLSLAAITAKKDFQDMNYLISKAESPWRNDPFFVYDSNRADLDDNASLEEMIELSYTGFILAGKKIIAVINGMEYTVGEMLKDVGYKIKKISPSKVVLLNEINKKIILQLKED